MKKAFNLSVTVHLLNSKKYFIVREKIIADQKLNINLIYSVILQYLKLKKHAIEKISLRSFNLIITNESVYELKHWVFFIMIIADIKRIIWVFIYSSSERSMSLLLKVSYLISMNVQIYIWESVIEIENINFEKL